MRRIFNILAVLLFAFTVMSPKQVIADAASQRDAVYASEDKPHGNGAVRDAQIKDSSDIIRADVGAISNIQASTSIPSSIEQTCAWRDPEFRIEYLALLEQDVKGDAGSPEASARYDELMEMHERMLAGLPIESNSSSEANLSDGALQTENNIPVTQLSHEFMS